MRTGIGYDIHRFQEGRKLILGGVVFDYPLGLLGHSDADVVTHALCDALLGAAGAGDIGRHFPDTDERFRGISSLILLQRTGGIVRERGFEIVNADLTVILEKPRLAEVIPEMEANLERSLGLGPGRINVKAATNENLGSLGRGEGIAALAVVSLREPGDLGKDARQPCRN